MGRIRFDGSPMPGFAFGVDLPDSVFSGLEAKDYLFEILVAGDGRLQLAVDVYTALGLAADPEAFDVDRWEDMKLVFEASATRSGFGELARIGRSLLAGRTVRFPDGKVLSLAMVGAAP